MTICAIVSIIPQHEFPLFQTYILFSFRIHVWLCMVLYQFFGNTCHCFFDNPARIPIVPNGYTFLLSHSCMIVVLAIFHHLWIGKAFNAWSKCQHIWIIWVTSKIFTLNDYPWLKTSKGFNLILNVIGINVNVLVVNVVVNVLCNDTSFRASFATAWLEIADNCLATKRRYVRYCLFIPAERLMSTCCCHIQLLIWKLPLNRFQL